MAVRSRALTAALGAGLLVLVLAGAYTVLGGYPAELRGRFEETGPAAPVVDLQSVEQLRAAFNQESGTARLVVLFSPT